MNSNKLDSNYPKNEFYSLTHVIGQGSKSGFAISSNSRNGLITYITGPYLIFYDMFQDKQVAFLKNTNNKIIACVDFSSDGNYFATGEGNCKNAEITIYKISYNGDDLQEKHTYCTSFKNHKNGIEKVKFFNNDQFLISIGNKDDKNINIFDIERNEIIFSTKYNRSIFGFDISDVFMVMSGDKFAKIYNFEKIVSKDSNDNSRGCMNKSVVDLAKLKDKAFIAACIYKNEGDIDTPPKEKVFFLTFDCFLAEMELGNNLINRWVNLKSEKGLCLTIFGKNVACGCSDGILRLFHADNLTHIMTIHKPYPLGKINVLMDCKTPQNFPKETSKYADIILLNYNSYYQKLIATYSNGTTILWDAPLISDKKDRTSTVTNNLYRAFTTHSGSITSIDVIQNKEDGSIKLATCSDDGTAIYWNLSVEDLMSNDGGFPNKNNDLASTGFQTKNFKAENIQYSQYIRHVFFLNSDDLTIPFKVNKEEFLNQMYNEEDDDKFKLTCIKFTPDKNHLLTSDNQGNIYLLNLKTLNLIKKIELHSNCINSLDSITDSDNNKTFMVSGGNDLNLIFVDISKYLNLTEKNEDTLDDNSMVFEELESPVKCVQLCIDKYKEIKVIAAESECTITFFKVLITPNKTPQYSLLMVQKYKDESLQTYCLYHSPTLNKILSGHNGQIRIWKTSSCLIHKHFQVCKGDKPLDNFRVTSDNTGRMFATSNNDKIIRMRALHDGKLLTKIPIAESISALFFVLNDNFLIAVSVEGYIYFYRLNMEYVEKLSSNNDLINSREENEKIQRKLKFLQQWIKYDNNLSKVEHVKYLIEKNMNSEELTFDDLKILDSYYKEEKSKLQIKGDNKDKKDIEQIELMEELGNNNDDLENDNINYDNAENNKVNMSKSKMFERGLKEKSSFDYKDGNRKSSNPGRVSIVDSLKSKNNSKCKFQIAKQGEDGEQINPEQISVTSKFKKEEDSKEDNVKQANIPSPTFKKNIPSSNKSKQIDELQKIVNNTCDMVNQIDDKFKKQPNNNNFNAFNDAINTQEENDKFNPYNINENNMPLRNNPNRHNDVPEDIIPEEINEDSKLDPAGSYYSKKDFIPVMNSQKYINQSYVRNMMITQSNMEFGSLTSNTDSDSYYKKIVPSSYKPKNEIFFNLISKVPKKVNKISNEISNYTIKGNPKIPLKKCLDSLKTFDLNSASKSDLALLETTLEDLLDKIRLNKGTSENDVAMERMLAKYSALLIKKVDSSKKK